MERACLSVSSCLNMKKMKRIIPTSHRPIQTLVLIMLYSQCDKRSSPRRSHQIQSRGNPADHRTPASDCACVWSTRSSRDCRVLCGFILYWKHFPLAVAFRLQSLWSILATNLWSILNVWYCLRPTELMVYFKSKILFTSAYFASLAPRPTKCDFPRCKTYSNNTSISW